MLIENKKEIYNLAWLDSDYFDKEGFLLVRDYSTDEQYSYVERFCRIKGKLINYQFYYQFHYQIIIGS